MCSFELLANLGWQLSKSHSLQCYRSLSSVIRSFEPLWWEFIKWCHLLSFLYYLCLICLERCSVYMFKISVAVRSFSKVYLIFGLLDHLVRRFKLHMIKFLWHQQSQSRLVFFLTCYVNPGGNHNVVFLSLLVVGLGSEFWLAPKVFSFFNRDGSLSRELVILVTIFRPPLVLVCRNHIG